MNTFKKILLGAALAGACATATANDDTARDLYFNPTKALFGGSGSTVITSNQTVGSGFVSEDNGNLGDIENYYEKLENPGVTYSIELLRVGSSTPKRVSGSYVFKQGDRIRIHVSTNGDGYMHALHKGTSGNTMLVPISTGGRVSNGQDITIPSANGWMKFDHQKGIEKLDLVFASHTDSSSMGIVPNESNTASLISNIQQIAMRYSDSKDLVTFDTGGEKDLLIEGGSGYQTAGVINRTNRPVVQVSQEIYDAPATYAVNVASEPVAIKINLKHQ